MSFENPLKSATPRVEQLSTKFTIDEIETQLDHIINKYDEKVQNLKSDDADVREVGREYLIEAGKTLAEMNTSLVDERGTPIDETKGLYAKVTELQARIEEVLSN